MKFQGLSSPVRHSAESNPLSFPSLFEHESLRAITVPSGSEFLKVSQPLTYQRVTLGCECREPLHSIKQCLICAKRCTKYGSDLRGQAGGGVLAYASLR